MFLGLPLTYFLLAPADKMGLEAGATGLAIKMVLIQFFLVNVQLIVNARFLKLRFWRYLGHQIISVVCLYMVAMLAMLLVDCVLDLQDKIFYSFLVAGILYTLMVLFLTYFQPLLFGLGRSDIQFMKQWLIGKLKIMITG